MKKYNITFDPVYELSNITRWMIQNMRNSHMCEAKEYSASEDTPSPH